MNITLIVIGFLITLSTLSSLLILTALALSGSYWDEEAGQELFLARVTETIGELQRETVPST